MTAGGALLVAVLLGSLVWAVIFGKTKPKWHPFGGVFKHDKRTGQLTVTVRLPGKKRAKGARKGKR